MDVTDGEGVVDGVELVIGGERIRYHPSGADVDTTGVPNFRAGDDRLARDHPRLRRILVSVVRGGPPASMLLHWSDGSDLRTLDELFAAGGSGEEYLANAAAGEFLDHLCPGCDTWFRVVDLSTNLTYALGIPLENLAGHAFHDTCPNCGTPTRRSILEFMSSGG